MFNVIIWVDKNFTNYDLLKDKCDFLLSKKEKEDLCILNTGENSLVEKYALESGIKFKEIKADWDNKGPKAGYYRNTHLTDLGNAIIFFYGPDSENKGAKLLKNMSSEKHLLIREVKEDE